MARQRFIWPDLWSDPGFAELDDTAKVLYIGCFSNADDDGRLVGEIAYLRSIVFPMTPISPRKLKSARDQMLAHMPKLALYVDLGVEYLAFTNWREWQKPKYPKASKLPAPPDPSGNDSPNDSGKPSGNDSSVGWDGLGRDGKNKNKPPAANASVVQPVASQDEQKPDELAAAEAPRQATIAEVCQRHGADPKIVEPLAQQLDAHQFAKVADTLVTRCQGGRVANPAGLLVTLLEAALTDLAKQERGPIHIQTIEEQIAAEAAHAARSSIPIDAVIELVQHKMRRLKTPAEDQPRLERIARDAYNRTEEAA